MEDGLERNYTFLKFQQSRIDLYKHKEEKNKEYREKEKIITEKKNEFISKIDEIINNKIEQTI